LLPVIRPATLHLYMPLLWGKPAGLLTLCFVDMVLNSTFEYDESSGNDIFVILMVVSHFFIQIGAFIFLYLMLSDTYLFQIGIIGPLYSQFRTAAYVHFIYATYTFLLGFYRARNVLNGKAIYELWDSEMYLMLSVAHKLVAIIYYYQNMSTVIKLGNSMFYSREAWVRMLSHRDAT